MYYGTFDPSLTPDGQLKSVSFRQAGSEGEPFGSITGMTSAERMLYMSTLSGLAFGKFGAGREATRLLGGTEVFCHEGSLVGTSEGLYNTDGNLVALPDCPIYSIYGFRGGYLLGSDSQIIDYRLSGSITKTRFGNIQGKVESLRAYGNGIPGDVVLFKTVSGDVYQFSPADGQISALTS